MSVPVQVPAGWSQEAAWVSPGLLSDAPGGHTVLVSGDLVFAAVETSEGPSLAALRGSDGEVVWTSLLDEALTGPPQLLTVDDKPSVVAATEHSLLVWRVDAAAEAATPQRWSFTEADVRPVQGSPAPLLVNRETLTALVLVEGSLRKRDLPSPDVGLLAGTSSGEVVAIADSGHRWVVTGEDKPSAILLDPPGYGSLVVELVGLGGHTVIVSWTRGRAGGYLVGYDLDRGLRPRWKVETRSRVRAEEVRISADGSWLIAAETAVDVESGKSRRLATEWETVSITDTAAWSRSQVVRRRGRPSKLARPVSDPSGVPVAITADGLGLVVAQETSGDAVKVYAVDPSEKSTGAIVKTCGSACHATC